MREREDSLMVSVRRKRRIAPEPLSVRSEPSARSSLSHRSHELISARSSAYPYDTRPGVNVNDAAAVQICGLPEQCPHSDPGFEGSSSRPQRLLKSRLRSLNMQLWDL